MTLNCPICHATAKETEAGRLVLTHDREAHRVYAVRTAEAREKRERAARTKTSASAGRTPPRRALFGYDPESES